MKTNALQLTALLTGLGAMLLVAGCASLEHKNRESLLSAAGFRVHTPKTSEQREIYAALPSYRVHRAIVKNKVFYVYKDPKRGVAYIGNEAQYQRFERLAIQENISTDYWQPGLMNQETAMDWYGAWGPGAFAW
jgi:hypothetical protein